MLIVGRAIAGAGGSGIVTGIMTIIAHVIPLKNRPGLFPRSLGTIFLADNV
jgi:MFS family permease